MPARVKRNNPEREFHRSVAQYLDIILTRDTYWTTIGHGGGGKVRGAILHGMGMKPGVPDIMLVRGGMVFFLELKAKRGVVSPDQIVCHDMIMRAGGRVKTCKTIESVTAALREWNIPLRSHLL